MRKLAIAAIVAATVVGFVTISAGQGIPSDRAYLCVTGIICPKLPSQFPPTIPLLNSAPPPKPFKMPVIAPTPPPKIVKPEPFAPVVAPPPTTTIIRSSPIPPPDQLYLEREQQEYRAQQQVGWALGYAAGMGIRKMLRHHKISTYCRKNPVSGNCPAWIDLHMGCRN